MAIGWLDEPHNRRMIAALDYVDSDAIRRQTPSAIAQMHAFGRRILPRFAALCVAKPEDRRHARYSKKRKLLSDRRGRAIDNWFLIGTIASVDELTRPTRLALLR